MKLSNSKHPAYHLRPNKAIDRLILVELVRVLELIQPLQEHVYIGFGGPFLEDFRLLAQMFPYLKLISIERDQETHKRQLYHLCSSNMDALHCTFKDFLATRFPSDQPIIAWADYIDMTRECLLEAADVSRRATPWSLYRITVRAETPIRSKLRLGFRIPKRPPKNKKDCFESIVKHYRDEMVVDGIPFDPKWFTWENFSDDGFPILLMRMIEAVVVGSCSHPKTFLPLHAVKYSDGTIMLSLTGIFCPVDQREEVINHFKRYFPFCGDDDRIDEIDVPILTTKERLRLDKVLPSSDCGEETCLNELGYLVEGDGSDALSVRKMKHYERYYRLYPYFGRLLP